MAEVEEVPDAADSCLRTGGVTTAGSHPAFPPMSITEQKRRHNPHQPVGRWIRVDKRLAIYLRDRFSCLYCGRDLHGVSDPRHIQLDHLLPRSEGGNNSERNVFTSCMACNCSRGSKPVSDYAPGGAVRRIAKHVRMNLTPFRKLAKAILAGEIDQDHALETLR